MPSVPAGSRRRTGFWIQSLQTDRSGAHKGRTWFELTVTGITAHASNPWKGADAIAAMAEVISSIRKEIAACPPHHDLGISTVTFGQIQGATGLM